MNAVAGERQRGTLEVLLARPVSRRRLYVTLLVATILFVAVAMAAQVLGTIVGLTASGALAELQPERLAIMWLNGVAGVRRLRRGSPWRRRSRSIG